MASKQKTAKITELAMIMNDYLAQDVPDRQMQERVTRHIVSGKILQLLHKPVCVKQDWLTESNAEETFGLELTLPDNLNGEHHSIWISNYLNFRISKQSGSDSATAQAARLHDNPGPHRHPKQFG